MTCVSMWNCVRTQTRFKGFRHMRDSVECVELQGCGQEECSCVGLCWSFCNTIPADTAQLLCFCVCMRLYCSFRCAEPPVDLHAQCWPDPVREGSVCRIQALRTSSWVIRQLLLINMNNDSVVLSYAYSPFKSDTSAHLSWEMAAFYLFSCLLLICRTFQLRITCLLRMPIIVK